MLAVLSELLVSVMRIAKARKFDVCMRKRESRDVVEMQVDLMRHGAQARGCACMLTAKHEELSR